LEKNIPLKLTQTLKPEEGNYKIDIAGNKSGDVREVRKKISATFKSSEKKGV
jgi:hypothetical protein